MAGCRHLLAFLSPKIFWQLVCWMVCFWLMGAAALFAQQRTALLLEEEQGVAPISDRKLLPWQGPPAAQAWTDVRVQIPPPVLPRKYPVTSANPGLSQDVFQQLVRSAGIIFAGRVMSVGPAAPSSGPAHAATSITFLVERAIRGTLPNQSVTIREWGGLWERGERYRVGERVLLFLYGPSRLGLTSPVAGAVGRFALNSQGKIVMSAAHIAAFAGNPILRGRAVVSYGDFALAMQNVHAQERIEP